MWQNFIEFSKGDPGLALRARNVTLVGSFICGFVVAFHL